MFTLQLDEFMVEFEEGTLKHVGPATQGATAKLYHVADAEARAFGDSQVKLGFDDGEGNEVEVALSPEAAGELAADLESLAEEGLVSE